MKHHTVEGNGMTITLQDPMLLRDPASRHSFPEMRHEGRLRAARTLAMEILARYARGGDRGRSRASRGANR